MRQAGLQRNTKETQIQLTLDLDHHEEWINFEPTRISTPIGFFNHMLELFCFHSCINMQLKAAGDVDVDDHH